ncbi:sensor histidine kinase [Paenibacillus thermotolerans]|uniref:sensor histidine kinase n=1 Tax=Paenibacillus thermotolerans TaxID=3027807 RepID=UPI00236889F7|nr:MULTISPECIES: sensor histidine kinase [unclassified Paenibacillus]
MNYFVKTVLFLYVVVELIIDQNLSYQRLALLLLILAIQLWKERFYDSLSVTVVTLAVTCAGVAADLRFSVLFAICFYDFMLKRVYLGVAASIVCVLYFLAGESELLLTVTMWIILCSLLAFAIRKGRQEESEFIRTLDNERRLRYELEQTKAKLLHSSKQIASIAEVKERNRIARDIHDSVGHGIAGILIQLQAAYKLHAKDEAKSMEIVKHSIDGLTNALQLLRDTVHNIKPREEIGVGYIRGIIEQFRFCPVHLKLSGDFNRLPADHLELLSTNIKEALTNAARHSQATEVNISIDANERYTRLYIKDNGIGCSFVKEGLGLSGMKERVKNVGGSISISADEGFLIVCLLPRQEGGGIFESFDRG